MRDNFKRGSNVSETQTTTEAADVANSGSSHCSALHPPQPLIRAKDGVVRFKENAIVRFLLDAGPFDMNQLALMPFSDEDRAQFAQLIGYSLGGFGDLSYVTDMEYGRVVHLDKG